MDSEGHEYEYYLDEALSDLYEWDREKVLDYAKETLKLSEYVIGWLENNLPEYPEYE